MIVTESCHFLDVFDNVIASSESSFSQMNLSEVQTLQRIRKYFTTVQTDENSVPISTVQQNKIDYIKTRLQHIADNENRIQVNQKQLEKLFELPVDADIMLILSTYYACFYMVATPLKAVLTKKNHLINELLCAAYHEIVSKLIEKKMPHDQYFSNRIIMQLRTSKTSRVRATYDIIAEVAAQYQLPTEEIIVFIENSIKNSVAVEHWPTQYLHQYMHIKQQPENATLDDFLRETKLHTEFTADQIVKYDNLFRSYVTKLVGGQIGTFLAKKAIPASLSSPVATDNACGNKNNTELQLDTQPVNPLDILARNNIMILWLDDYIGCDENCRALKNEFRKITNSLKMVSSVESCRQCLPYVKNRKLFCIIQGRYAKEIVPDIVDIISPSMNPIVYIFTLHMKYLTEWAMDQDCVMEGGIFDHEKHLLDKLTIQLNDYVKQKSAEYQNQFGPDVITKFLKTFTEIMTKCYRTKDTSVSHDARVPVNAQ